DARRKNCGTGLLFRTCLRYLLRSSIRTHVDIPLQDSMCCRTNLFLFYSLLFTSHDFLPLHTVNIVFHSVVHSRIFHGIRFCLTKTTKTRNVRKSFHVAVPQTAVSALRYCISTIRHRPSP